MLAVMANHVSPTGAYPTAGWSAAWSEAGKVIAQADAEDECNVLAENTPEGWIGNVIPS